MSLKTSRPARGGRTRLLIAAGVVLVVAAAALVWRAPHEAGVSETTMTTSAPPVTTPAPQADTPAVRPADPRTTAAQAAPVDTLDMPVASAGQRAFIDPKTGKMRQPDANDLAALEPRRRAQRAARAEGREEFAGTRGAIGVALTEDEMTSVVATRNADGTVSIEHVTGLKNADAAVRTASKKPTVKKEEKHDR
jgi:hypothetical protein